MTPRALHLLEMRYAIAHGCSLAEARAAVLADRRRLAHAAIENLRNQPVVPGRDLRGRDRSDNPATGSGRTVEGLASKPWMMAD